MSPRAGTGGAHEAAARRRARARRGLPAAAHVARRRARVPARRTLLHAWLGAFASITGSLMAGLDTSVFAAR